MTEQQRIKLIAFFLLLGVFVIAAGALFFFARTYLDG